jgi:hypothetical protein
LGVGVEEFSVGEVCFEVNPSANIFRLNWEN